MADSRIPSVNRPSVALPALVLGGIIAFFGFHGTGGEWLDFQIQSWFWDGRDWLIPKDAGWFHSLAYDGPKVGLILFAVGLLWAIAFPARSPAWLGRRRAIYLFLSMAIIALTCTQLRDVTQMATPRALKVYGADYTYKSPKEKVTAEPRGGVAGKGWMVDAPTVVDPKRPKILFYGDSISGGYRQYLLPAVEGKVYAYHWVGFVGGLDTKVDGLIKQGASVADFDLVFFNNGLHSLSWTPEKATDQQTKIATQWLKLLAMDARWDQPFSQLSYGDQRLILIARAMVKHPHMLILDEPCLGLDDLNRQLVLALIDRICRGSETTVLYVNHHQEDAIDGIEQILTLGRG